MEMLLTTEQAAQRASVHPETIRRQVKRGTLRAVRIGSRLRIPESALLEQKVEPKTKSCATALVAAQDARSLLKAATTGPLNISADLEEVRGGND